jgi:hypothetical protein
MRAIFGWYRDPGRDLGVAGFEAAIQLATKADLAVPPRAYTGTGHVLRLQGRDAEAQAAFDKALELDEDNTKARDAKRGGGGKT